jgi:hypothetical protein
MENTQAGKIAGAAGLFFVVALIVSTIIAGSPPMADDSTAKVASFFSDHRDRILVSNYVGGLAIVSLLVFAACLWDFLRSVEGNLAGPSTLVVVGGTAVAATATVGTMFSLVLAYRLPASPDLVRTFYDANLLCFSFIGFPAAVFIGGASAAVLRSGVLPGAVGMIGGLAALLQLVGAASFATSGAFMPGGPMGFVAFISILVWALAISGALLTRKPGSTPATA